ncbi:methyltransferase domain-containing protein [Microbacterium sp. M28]|uniref:methyltransferase domain-containing protein n=1 Tax=Microbacterium sp. M28 TaxID=2962064 RepID=UPI0021F43024|nr:methyltransferase domain-containing protein [Microbacterium sp. M28]UYO95948.1 methyltransferase domain-containing protein [Microbacterium sp. M28]
MPDLRSRDTSARELMDDPDADRIALEATYRRFRMINALVGGWRRIYLHRIRTRVRAGDVRILDIGSGGGDVTRRIARWVRRDASRAIVTALDADPRATAWAERQSGPANIRYRTGTTADLVAAGERFDVVVSNHLLHHLDSVPDLLRETEALLAEDGIAVHVDIARSRRAYALFDALTRVLQPFLVGSFIRADGLTSIRRSYTVAELAERAPQGWTAVASSPHRVVLLRGGVRA